MSVLTLIRHGQSIWNQQNRFTGWVDVSLSQIGTAEAQHAAKMLVDQRFDVAFTSALLRAQDTLYEILRHNNHCHDYARIHETNKQWYEHFVPTPTDSTELKVYVSQNLNERYYGDLQGLNKDKAKQIFGEQQVQIWRRSYDTAPPNGESLAMTANRVISYYQSYIFPRLQKGENVLICAHGNSLRAIIMHIEEMTNDQIAAYELKTATPHIYDFDNQMNLQHKNIIE